jgi:membrane protein DedA with SNARE-associated domain
MDVLVVLELLLRVKYAGILIFMFLENTALPLPGELILVVAGYFIYLNQLNYWGVVFAASLGALLGSLLLYWIGKRYGETTVERYGKLLFLKKEDLRKGSVWFDRYGESAVFFGNFIPVIRHVISIPAGTAQMNVFKFSFYTFASAFLWNMLIVYVCAMLGREWDKLFLLFEPLKLVTIIILCCIVVAIVIKKIWKI